MARHEMAIKFKDGLYVTMSHDRLFASVNIRDGSLDRYLVECGEMSIPPVFLKPKTSVCVGISGESRPLIQIEDAKVDYYAHRRTGEQELVVTKGVINGGSIPFAFLLDFDEIVFRKCHEESTP